MRRALTTTLIALSLAATAACGQQPTGSGGPEAKSAPDAELARLASGNLVTPGCQDAVIDPSPSWGPASAPVNQERLSDLAQELRTGAEKDFKASFAEVAISSETDRVLLYRKPNADLDTYVLAGYADRCVELVDVKYTATELEAYARQVADDTKYWQAQGIPVYTVALNVPDGVITVGTSQVEKAKIALVAKYGKDFPMEVEKGSEVHLLTQ